MRKRTSFFLFIFFGWLTFLCQEKEFRIGFLAGINKIYWGASPNATKIGNSQGLEFSFRLKSTQNAISFEPIIFLSGNSLCSKVDRYTRVRVTQVGIDLMPMVGLNLKKDLILKIGFFARALASSEIRALFTNTGYLSIGTAYLNAGYNARDLQAGFATGLSVKLGELCNFNILLQQFVVPFLNSDYELTSFPAPGKNSLVFNNKSKPTILMAGFNFKIGKKKIDKEAE